MARDFEFEDQLEVIEAHEGLIVTFTHHSTDEFPVALARFERRYGLPLSMTDETGRGVLIFDVAGGDA